jgi:predicted secreted acid phosphatase
MYGMGKGTIRKVRGFQVLNDEEVVVRVTDNNFFTNGYRESKEDYLLKKKNYIGQGEKMSSGKFTLKPIVPDKTPDYTDDNYMKNPNNYFGEYEQGGKTRRHKKKSRKSRKSRKNRKF